jgi:hypothetical protein
MDRKLEMSNRALDALAVWMEGRAIVPAYQ